MKEFSKKVSQVFILAEKESKDKVAAMTSDYA